MAISDVVVSSDGGTVALDLVGIMVGSLLGARVAMQERFDITGTLVLAISSGLGGGIIRDVLISTGPPLAHTEASYLTTAVVGALVMLFVDVGSWKHGARALALGDALLLGFFTAAGCQRATLVELPLLSVALLGIVTAVGGGMMRDVLVGRAPAVLQGGTLYASVSIVAAVVYTTLEALDVRRATTVVACIVVGFALRLAAMRWELALPTEPQPLGPQKLIGRLRETKREAGLFRRDRRRRER
jgi:uncharacterized membrane protein YeiH